MSKQAFFCTETVKNASDVVEPPFVSSNIEESKEQQYASNSTKNSHVPEAFERINLLCDQDTFTPQTLPKSDNDEDFVITGQTLIRGRAIQIVYLSVSGTRVSKEHVRQLKDAFQDAGAIRTPVVCLYDFRCTSIQEGKSSLSGLPFFFGRNMSVSGEVPLISLTFGPSLGAVRSLHPSSSFIFRVKNGYDMAASSKPEMPYFSFEQDIDGLKSAREFIHFLTSLREETENFDPTTRRDDTLNSIISPDPNTTYNMKNIIRSIVDDGNFCELMLDPARNIHTGFAQMNGQVVAIVANQTCETAGVLNYDSSAMTARFVRFANDYHVPILTFVDVPGLLYEGDVLRKGRELLLVYKDATVPRITIVTRKAHNDAYDVISSEYLRGKFNYSWATTPQISSKNMAAKKSLYHSIEPSTTRQRICKDLESLKSRKSDQPEHLSWKEVTWVVRNWLLILFSLFVLIRYVC